MLFAAQPLLQLGVDRITQVLVFRAEGQGAVAGVRRVVGEIADGLDLFTAFLGQALHGQLGADGGVGATGAYGLQLCGGVGHLEDLRLFDPGIAGIGQIHRAGHDRQFHVGILGDIGVAVQVFRVAFGHQQGIGQLVLRVGEDHLLAARRGDVHARGNHVEASRTQARDQRAPLGEHAIDFLDAHFLEDDLGDFRRLAGNPAVGFGKGEGGFVGIADADAVVLLDRFQRGCRLGAGHQAEGCAGKQQLLERCCCVLERWAHR
ncbi:hypothetical protein D9M71_542660 [compost metagenome]